MLKIAAVKLAVVIVTMVLVWNAITSTYLLTINVRPALQIVMHALLVFAINGFAHVTAMNVIVVHALDAAKATLYLRGAVKIVWLIVKFVVIPILVLFVLVRLYLLMAAVVLLGAVGVIVLNALDATQVICLMKVSAMIALQVVEAALMEFVIMCLAVQVIVLFAVHQVCVLNAVKVFI